MAVVGICQFFGRYFGNLINDDRYLVFQSPNGDGENTISDRKYYSDGIYTKNLITVLR